MANVRPFRALRPRDDLAGEVIAPPYDVLSEDEARSIARNPRSFVRITRSEVDLPHGTDPHGEEAYRTARANLDQFVADGVLVRDPAPTYYFYELRMDQHVQTGVLAGCSVEEYDAGDIARHELTRPDKEDDRTHHMDVLDAQVGLVFLAYRPTLALSALTRQVTAAPPLWEVTTEDDVVHRLWAAPAELVEPIRAAFAAVPRLYIADGHHRSAAASRIHALRRSAGSASFLSGLFPADELQVLAYNRVVRDLNGATPEAFRASLERKFVVAPGGSPRPAARGEFAMYLAGQWWSLTARPEIRSTDPVGGLDVSLLQDHVLGPLLGVEDPRTSKRIDFVGGIRGTSALADAVDQRGGVAFSLFPTSLDELFAVADSGKVMPPKSTWFEPKLREGVVVRSLDEVG